MIKKLSVKNFKSIKELEIDCKRINVFIGEPNTGKSNILESPGLLSWCVKMDSEEFSEYVRFLNTQNLFYDEVLDQPVEIHVENYIKSGLRIRFDRDRFFFEIPALTNKDEVDGTDIADMDYFGKIMAHFGQWEIKTRDFDSIKFYRFAKQIPGSYSGIPSISRWF